MAAPIEQQVNGVESMMYMSSQCTNDGSYTLTVTFELGTDLNMAQVLVQNRVALALPQLPDAGPAQGVTHQEEVADILLVVNLISPDGRYDDLYLSNYATIQLQDELLRIEGVGDVIIFGQRDYSMRVWLDPDKLASREPDGRRRGQRAIQSQNVQVAAGQIGQPPVPRARSSSYPMSTLGRLVEAKQFGDIIVKTGGTAAEVRPTQPSTAAGTAQVGHASATSAASSWARSNTTRSAGSTASRRSAWRVFQLPGSNALERRRRRQGSGWRS